MSFSRLMTLQADLGSPLGGRSNAARVRVRKGGRGSFHRSQIVRNRHRTRFDNRGRSRVPVRGNSALLEGRGVAELLERGRQMNRREGRYHPRHVHVMIRRGALVVRHQSVSLGVVVGGQHALQMRRIGSLELEFGRSVHGGVVSSSIARGGRLELWNGLGWCRLYHDAVHVILDKLTLYCQR